LTTLLNDNAPKIIQPTNLKLKLKEHQITACHAMDKLERNGTIEKTIKSSIYKFNIYPAEKYQNSYRHYQEAKNFRDIDYTIKTNFGILADKVGAGKTYEIVGLLCHNLVPPDRNKILFSSSFTSLEYKDSYKGFKTNLILVPHNLVTQWKQAFAQCNLKTYIISKKTDISFLVYPENIFDENPDKKNHLSDNELDDLENICELNTIEYYDAIICSATMVDEYFDRFKDIRYSRIIIDEVCSIKLPTDLNWHANFIWFVTATPSGIKYLKRFYIKDLVNRLHDFIFDNIIVKNDEEYVDRSMNVPSFNQILIKCFTPKQYEMIREHVPQDVMDMLNAGNVQEAVKKLNCNVDTDENILQVLTNKISKELHNKKAELTYQESLIPTDKKSHDEHIARINSKINSLQTKFDSISQRIKEFMKESCPICLEDFISVVPAVLPCCNQLYCITCLASINGSCPMCRQSFSMDKISVIMDNKNNNNNKNNKIDEEKKEINKVDAVIKLLLDKQNGKFLLFSNYDQTFENLIKKLAENEIKHSKVLGSGAVVNKTIQRFTDGDVRVLMLNASNYGSGLNLQMATDIIIYHQLPLELETQVIGRAQRLGRTSELNVYYLLHDHEQNNVTNPSLSLDLNNYEDLLKFDKHLGKIDTAKKVTKVAKVTKVNYDINLDDCPPEIFGENVITVKTKKIIAKKVRSKKSTVNSIDI